MLELEQNWQNYRTLINDHLAIISVNMEMFSGFPSPQHDKIAHFSLPYEAGEDGLPKPEEQESMFRNIIKSLSQVCALPDILYAGHIISDGKVSIYFYIEHEQPFIETVLQLVPLEEIKIQVDPDWDTYFDFLLPSQLEIKFSLTEDILDTMVENGLDLSQVYTVEHGFHFDHKEDMEDFIEKCSLQNISFSTIRYTDSPVQVENMEHPVYLLKLEQELQLDNQDIFNAVEQFDELSRQYAMEYIGWEHADFGEDKKYLN
ncbi:MAG TPA: TIGR01619 family protein [Pasteurellaceae bacterium]|nr:TIGR01619 family protein [Pasteurellaceae bacterium]